VPPAFGQWSWIRLVVERPVAKELQFVEHVLGRRCGMSLFDVVMSHKVSRLPGRPRPSRPSWRSLRRRADRARTRSSAEGRSASGGWQRRGYFASRCKARHSAIDSCPLIGGARRKIAAPLPLAARAACRSIALQKAVVAPSPAMGQPQRLVDVDGSQTRLYDGGRRQQEVVDVLRRQLPP
jgi:hypothetical protein